MRRMIFEDPHSEFDDFIDLTPMVNIALILVIVFLCVSPMTLITGIKAIESKSSGVGLGKSSKKDVIKLVLNKEGVIKLNGRELDRRRLVPYLKDVIAKSESKEVMLIADNDNMVKDVVYLLDISKQNGAAKVTIAEK